MDLNTYLKKERIKNITMANDLGFTAGFISKLRKKIVNPTLYNAFVISNYCNFQVTVPELIDQHSFDAFVQKKGLKSFDLFRCIDSIMPEKVDL